MGGYLRLGKLVDDIIAEEVDHGVWVDLPGKFDVLHA